MSTSPENKRPKTHYELLGLNALEPDLAVVRKSFNKRVDQVRIKIAEEPKSPRWPQMLTDMTKAMLVLSDVRRKNDYDQSLGGKAGRDVRLVQLHKLIRARKVLDDEPLEKARKLADTLNLDLHEAIINQKLAPHDVVMPLYAESLGMPFVDLASMTFDESLIPTVPAIMARQNTLVPVVVDDGQVIIASPKPLKPEMEEQLRLRFGAQIRQIICTKAAVDLAISRYYSREAALAEMHSVPQGSIGSAADKSSSTAALKVPARVNKAELRQKKLKIGAVSGMMTAMAIIFGLNLFTQLGQTNLTLVYTSAFGAGLVAFALGFVIVSD
ncbi:MAG: hypothetical protein K8U03_20125 [Planctomycetia bacterium]|nr:hypothetical protein [Planctomycetia bacterium]